tara:strand:+ start:27996 stop:29159 length:1164 start_codon:yes stop_codon:yes gene_type:complete
MKKKKLFRITTVPMSLKYLLDGQMSFMSKNGFDVVMISSDGIELKDVIKNESCRHIIVPLTRKITIFKDLFALFTLLRFLKKEKPDIVHTHTPKAGIIGMFASYLANIPIRLHTVAGLPLLEATGFKKFILNLVEILTYYFATKIYPNSYGLKKIILENKFTSENKIKVIGNGSSNGIDTSYFNPKKFTFEEKNTLKNYLGIENSDFVYTFLGRIVSDKGINELVKSFEKLSKEKKGIKLLIVGPFEDNLDPIKNETKYIIENNKKIILTGYKNDVRPYFAVSNLLVFPSYREGFPNAVMQAGSMALPCIVSDINGCNEIITNNINGLIVPSKDDKALYDAMKKILGDEILYKKLKNNSRSMIEKLYERKSFWKLLLDEYNYHSKLL